MRMRVSTAFLLVDPLLAVLAQRPSNISICDYYTSVRFKENNAVNQQILLTFLINTAMIGNYEPPEELDLPTTNTSVPGVLSTGKFNDDTVNLYPYFSGVLASANRGDDVGVSIDFLGDGGFTTLRNNQPANSNSSDQYSLWSHMYQYFAFLIGCSEYGNTTDAYGGNTSMYEVHKYMALNDSQVGYFIQQIGLSFTQAGVSEEDVTAVSTSLKDAVAYRCAPQAAIPATATPALQAICIKTDCPIASSGATCAAYAAVVDPSTVSSSTTTSPTSTQSVSSFNPSPTPSSRPHGTHLDSGAKAGIGVGVTVAVCMGVGIFYSVFRRLRRQKPVYQDPDPYSKAELPGKDAERAIPELDLDREVRELPGQGRVLEAGSREVHELEGGWNGAEAPVVR